MLIAQKIYEHTSTENMLRFIIVKTETYIYIYIHLQIGAHTVSSRFQGNANNLLSAWPKCLAFRNDLRQSLVVDRAILAVLSL